jgi:hypothetical protein
MKSIENLHSDLVYVRAHEAESRRRLRVVQHNKMILLDLQMQANTDELYWLQDQALKIGSR